jgi:hypothetical protein
MKPVARGCTTFNNTLYIHNKKCIFTRYFLNLPRLVLDGTFDSLIFLLSEEKERSLLLLVKIM